MIRVVFSKNMEGIHGEVKYQRMYGNSADSKPTSGLATGSRFIEVNTGKQYIYNEANQTWTEVSTGGGGGGGGDISDVRVNGTSVVSYGVANIPVADSSNYGAVKIGAGLSVNSSGAVFVNAASSEQIKAGTETNKPIVPAFEEEAAFYGLAKAAGDTTQAASSNPVGSYTGTAQYLIKKMIGAPTDWELIASYTTTEDLASVMVDTDSYSNAFHLTDMFAQVSLPQSTTGTKDYMRSVIKIKKSDEYATGYGPTLRYVSESGANWNDYRAEAICNTVHVSGRAGSTAGNSQGPQECSIVATDGEYLAISGFGMEQYSNSSSLIPSGTVIKIYGKRDNRF